MSIINFYLIAYFALMIAIGFYGRRYVKNYHNSLNIGKKGGLILIIGSCVGYNIGIGFVIGGAGKGSMVGLAGSAFGIGCAISSLCIAFFLSDFVYKQGYISFADYAKKRYNSNFLGIIYIFTTSISLVGVVGAQLIAGKILFETLDLNVKFFTILTALIIFAYSELSGLWGAYATSVVQTTIIICGMLIVTVAILINGGYSVIKEGVATGDAPINSLNFKGIGVIGFLSFCIPSILSTLTNQANFLRINSAKNAKVSKQAHFIAFIILIPLSIMPAFIGTYGAAKYGEIGDGVFFSVIFNELPIFISGLIVIAVLAAVMSTIDTSYSAVDALIICDFLEKILKKNLSENKLKVISFSINVFITIFAVIVSLKPSILLDFLTQFYTLIATSSFVPFIGGIIFKKAPSIAAILSSIGGIVCVIVNWFGVSFPIFENLFPYVVSILIFLICIIGNEK